MTANSAQMLLLPRLRQDLQILRAGPSYDGSPAWMLFDPLANHYFRLSFEMFQLLSLWGKARTVGELGHLIEQRFQRKVAPSEVEHAIRTLGWSHLFSEPGSGGWRALHGQAMARRHGWFAAIIHNYLYFRIPLWRPEAFLRAANEIASIFFTKAFILVTLMAGLCGLYLATRQWGDVSRALANSMSLHGLALYAMAIVVVKSIHELGHAFAAHRAGCRVPSIGVAFLVLTPMLYTDVTDAWKLKDKSSRLLIDCAGIIVELCIGAYALVLWSFLPDGPLRVVAFSLATVSLLLSLTVNLSPLMRFDGYYILSDLWGIENLQPRAFALLRWGIRKILFDLDDECPEHFSNRTIALMFIYAICAIIYRLILYLGIAILVYHFFIKIVGILLFAIELVFFILRPIVLEVIMWYRMRKEILAKRRTYLSLATAVILVTLCFWPISTRVTAPAIAEPAGMARIFPTVAGQVLSVDATSGQWVDAGAALVTLRSPDTEFELRKQRLELVKVQGQLEMIGGDPGFKSDRLVLENQAEAARTAIEGLQQRQKELVVRAPFAGRVAEFNRELSRGQWLGRSEQIASIERPGAVTLRGYVHERDFLRLADDAEGVFVPEDVSQASRPVRVVALARSGSEQIDIGYLASTNGGAIEVHKAKTGQEKPAEGYFSVWARAADAGVALSHVQRGSLVLDGRAESLAVRAWRQVLRVFIHEAGL